MRGHFYLAALLLLWGCKDRPTVSAEPAPMGAPLAEAPKKLPAQPDVLAEATESARSRVKAGFDTPEEIVDFVNGVYGDSADGDAGPDFAVKVKAMVEAAMAAQKLEEQSWPAVTDCDRLDRAFAALEGKHILARQNYADCQTCGVADIAAELKQTAGRGRGYVFFHDQDTEGVVDSGGLHLAYGAAEGGAAPSGAIAKEIVAELKRQGLVADWNGSVETRIHVSMDWKKRRFTRPGK